MVRLHKGDKTLSYGETEKDIVKYLPNGETIMSVKMLDNGGRKILYETSGWYYIEPTDKKKGVYAGDICQICNKGELVDYGGCATCNNCNAQLKCGL